MLLYLKYGNLLWIMPSLDLSLTFVNNGVQLGILGSTANP